jgi:hypothetical protein
VSEALWRGLLVDDVQPARDVEVVVPGPNYGIGRLEVAHEGLALQAQRLQHFAGLADAVGERAAGHEAFGAEAGALGQLHQPLLVGIQGVEGGQRRVVAVGGVAGEVAAHEAAPTADLLGAGVLDVGEDVGLLAGDGQIDVHRALLRARRRDARRRGCARPARRRPAAGSAGLGHVERPHAAQLLGVALDGRLGRSHVAADAHIDHVGLDHLQLQCAAADPLLGDLDAGQHAGVEDDPRGLVADGADHRNRLRLAEISA